MGRWFMSGIMIQTSAGEDGWHDKGKMLILHPDKRTSAGRAVAGETPAAMRRFDCPRVRPASSAARGIARRGCGIPSRVVTSMAEWNANHLSGTPPEAGEQSLAGRGLFSGREGAVSARARGPSSGRCRGWSADSKATTWRAPPMVSPGYTSKGHAGSFVTEGALGGCTARTAHPRGAHAAAWRGVGRVGDLVKVAGKWVDTEDLAESHTQTAALRVADGYRGCAALPWLLRSTGHWKKVICHGRSMTR